MRAATDDGLFDVLELLKDRNSLASKLNAVPVSQPVVQSANSQFFTTGSSNSAFSSNNDKSTESEQNGFRSNANSKS